MSAITMASKLSAAIGGVSAKKLKDSFGFETVEDLLLHYPRTYFEEGETTDLEQLPKGEHVTLSAKIISSRLAEYRDKRTGQMAYRVEALVSTGDSELSLTFFDKHRHTATWRKGVLAAGDHVLFSGKIDRFRDRLQLVHPKCEIFKNEAYETAEDIAAEKLSKLKKFRPIYAASVKVQTWDIEESVKIVLEMIDDVPEVVPPEVREKQDVISSALALAWIHRPEDWRQAEAARKALRFREAFVTQAVLAQRRAALMAVPAQPRKGVVAGLLDRFDERLPFELTRGQVDVSQQILDDLATGHPMHRLLQGEVGSGKTVVALRAMLRVVDSGGQAALLAPTEVLAQQHHRSITAMLGDLAAGGMLGGAQDGTQVALLTGSLGAAARKSAMLDAASGAAGILVGTHALLEEKVQFAELGLVVVDEQHRFGVEQRAALTGKAGEQPPHVLVMTATPIPRTVAMTVFGDLELSTLTELPAGRAPIKSSVVPMLDKPDWLSHAWTRVREEAMKGHQTYIVCPRIGGDTKPAGNTFDGEEADGAPPDGEETHQLAAVEEITPSLAEGVFAGLRVETLHGRLAPDHKERVMRSFAAGEIDVLVSTTVIEVGVDVPNATVMVVLDADRFGVSQLHQLRGRVGRGGLPGLCLLVTTSEKDSVARVRLEAVAAILDGFELSRLDLEQRREGDVLGAAQSGRRSGLRLLSVIKHEDVIVEARAAATSAIAGDPELSLQPALAEAVRRLNESEQADYLEKA